MIKMKRIIILFLLIGMMAVVSAFDEQLITSCGGDEELIIGCLGDNELFFMGFDLINPQISIIYPTNNLEITDVVTDEYSLNVNFSVIDVNLDSCWYTIDGGLTNIFINCLNGYNDFIIVITDFGDLTIDIFVRDLSDNENSAQVNFSVSSHTGPPSGGGSIFKLLKEKRGYTSVLIYLVGGIGLMIILFLCIMMLLVSKKKEDDEEN